MMKTIFVTCLAVAAATPDADPQVVYAGLGHHLGLAHHGVVLPSAGAVHHSTVVKSVEVEPATVETAVENYAVPVAAPLHYGYAGLHHGAAFGYGYGLGLHGLHGVGHVIAKRDADADANADADADAYYGYGLGYGLGYHGLGYHGLGYHGLGYVAHAIPHVATVKSVEVEAPEVVETVAAPLTYTHYLGHGYGYGLHGYGYGFPYAYGR